ncbi:MAG: YkgJ family cysteine cluster protein [Thermoplasmata archaeon]|nr:YkgJ family cysteine cluster protein [Thermoplasmata archaeon]
MALAYEKRGHCTQCGLCCLIAHKAKGYKRGQDHPRMLADIRDGWRIVRATKTQVWLAKWDPCPYLNFDFTCQLHGKPEQPETCRVWPEEPDGFYQVVKKRCGFRFRRLPKGRKK